LPCNLDAELERHVFDFLPWTRECNVEEWSKRPYDFVARSCEVRGIGYKHSSVREECAISSLTGRTTIILRKRVRGCVQNSIFVLYFIKNGISAICILVRLYYVFYSFLTFLRRRSRSCTYVADSTCGIVVVDLSTNCFEYDHCMSVLNAMKLVVRRTIKYFHVIINLRILIVELSDGRVNKIIKPRE